jgi:hypothetical protein
MLMNTTLIGIELISETQTFERIKTLKSLLNIFYTIKSFSLIDCQFEFIT